MTTELDLEGVAQPLDLSEHSLLSGADGRPETGAAAPSGPVSVASLAEANRVLRQILEHQLAIARIERDAKEQHDEISGWKDEACRPHEYEIGRLKLTVESWSRARMAADPLKRKSVRLPSGCVEVRDTGGALKVTDLAAFIAWARDARPEWLRIPDPEPKKTVIKDAVHQRDDGIVVTWDDKSGSLLEVPGLQLEQVTSQFWVRTAGGRR